MSRIAARARTALEARVDADALHASALVDLIWDRGGIALDRSIESLRTASRIAPEPGPVLADLAGALSERARRTEDAEDWFAAMDAAAEALSLAPSHPVAMYTLALSAQQLGIHGMARRTWPAVVAAQGADTAWARHARSDARRSAVEPAPPVDAQRLRERAFREVLGAWGSAVLAGRTGDAARHLATGDSIARVLAARRGDASVGDAMAAIRAVAGDSAMTRRLARAHAMYARAMAVYDAGDRVPAGDSAAAVLVLRPPSAPLARWAAALRLSGLVYDTQYERAKRGLTAMLEELDTLRHPALAGRAAWMLGTSRVRTGDYAGALRAARTAERHFARAGERENLGAVQAIAVDAVFALRDRRMVYRDARRAFTTLSAYPASRRLHNALAAAALRAAEDGMPHAALRLADEDVAVARATERAVYQAEAHLVRARVATSGGWQREAAASFDTGAAWLRRVPAAEQVEWLTADRQLTRAAMELAADPRRASAALDSAFAYFHGQENPLRALPLLVARGEARLAVGDSSGAADLDLAERSIAELSRADEARPWSAMMVEETRWVFDRALVLRLASGDTAGALEVADRSRGAVSGIAARVRPPAGEAAVVYAMVGDTLLTWVVGNGVRMRMHRRTLPRALLIGSVARLRWTLEKNDTTAQAAEHEIARLSRWLVHPVAGALPAGTRRLVVVADGEIAAIPFAALRLAGGAHLVERYSLRLAGSLAEAWRAPAAPRPEGTTLVVADPAFDREANPDPDSLPGAAAEGAEIAAGYPRNVLLTGAAATRAAVLGGLRGASILHFAGHARWDQRTPEQSWLLLAPGPGGDEGRLRADELGVLDLSHVKLVVLSSCQAIGSGRGRTGGFAGFARPVLAAGAGGMVGSLWQVNDSTTRELMREFHVAYRAAPDPAEALRRAQVKMLRSRDGRLRTPGAWSAFVYAGA